MPEFWPDSIDQLIFMFQDDTSPLNVSQSAITKHYDLGLSAKQYLGYSGLGLTIKHGLKFAKLL